MKTKLLRLMAAVSIVALLLPTTLVMARPEEPPVFEAVQVDSVVELEKEAIYIVLLEDAPLATFEGGVRGMTATSPMATGAAKLDAESPASVSYLGYLAEQQGKFIASAERELDRHLDVIYQYAAALNGLAARMTPAEAEALAGLPGVVHIERDFNRQIETDAGPGWMGVYGLWDGTATGGTPTQGEGMLIGVLDTGINMDHPSFAEVGPSDGYVHVNPLGDDVFLGLCATEPLTYTCNNKLIGAYDYVDAISSEADGPEDSNGHGSHTSSTAAGNTLEDVVVDLGGYVVTRTISGMAPHANIIMYDVCYEGGGCPNSATNAAISQAVMNGVDVINYSIGGGPSDPWQDSNSQAYLAARTAGVFVSTSAGNDGSAPGTVGSPANAPWLLSVGNASHNRTFMNSISFSGGGGALTDISGRSVGEAYGPVSIVHAKNYTSTVTANDNLCGDPFAPGTWSGEIVVCDRGGFALVDKAANVAAGGAGGVIIANAAANGEQMYATVLGLPSSHINYTDAEALRAWLDAGTGHMATLGRAEAVIDDAFGDRMSPSSSRGPNLPVLDVIKPSVIAPGTDILAAYHDGPEYAMIGGTSMASPHTAGVALLVRSAHPTWTPAEVQSAMESTALTAPIFKEDWVTEADPFDYGAGRTYAEYAVKAGFVLGETEANYTDADPLSGGDPSTLNLTVLGQDQCLSSCSWTRELQSTMDEAVTWTLSTTDGAISVDPISFTLPAGGTQVVTVTADVDGMTYDEWYFGRVDFAPDTADTVPAHFTVAANPSAGVLPESIDIETRRDVGAKLLEDLEVAESPDLTVEAFGLIEPTTEGSVVAQHPDLGQDFPDIFFGFTEVVTTAVSVPAGAKRLVAEVFDTTSEDLDMLVFPDMDDDGMPELADVDLDGEACQSAAGGPWESCDILEPSEGTWFVMILNYTEVQPGGDPVTLGTAVVTGVDAGNMSFDQPSSVATATPFSMTLMWDEMMAPGDVWYGGFSVGTTSGTPGDIRAVIPVTIVRLEDDVAKAIDNVVRDASGITVTYEIAVQPNLSGDDYTVTFTDTIPAGMTYVPGSATGGATVAGDQLTWSIAMDSDFKYVGTDNTTDASCSTPWGPYMDWLTVAGFTPDPDVSGDTDVWTAFSTYGGFEYYGKHYDSGLSFADDGFAMLDPGSNYGGAPWTNQMIPDSDAPNNVIAAFWKDLEIVYDAATNKGVTMVGTGPGGVAVVEYDDVQPYDGDGSIHYDFEIFMWTSAGPGPEIMFAYDNVVGPVNDVTVGLEDETGTLATPYWYNEPTPIADGLIVCFDYVGPEEVLVTYQATVDDPWVDGTYVNTVVHDTDALGTVEAGTEETFTVVALPTITKTVDRAAITKHGDIVTYTITLDSMSASVVSDLTMTDQLPSEVTFDSWVLQNGATLTQTDTVEWTGSIAAGGTESFIFTAKTITDTAVSLVDVTNTAEVGRGGQAWDDSVSFVLARPVYMPLIMKAAP